MLTTVVRMAYPLADMIRCNRWYNHTVVYVGAAAVLLMEVMKIPPKQRARRAFDLLS